MSGEYDFCPKCGALMRDGVCQSCGFGRPDAAGGMENRTDDGRQQGVVLEKDGLDQEAVPGQDLAPEQDEAENYYTPLGSSPQSPQSPQPTYSGGAPLPPYGQSYGAQNNGMNSNTPMPGAAGPVQNGGGGMPPYGMGNMYSGSQPGNGGQNHTGLIIAICAIAAVVFILIVVGGIFAQKALRRSVDERRADRIHHLYDDDDDYAYDDDDDYYDDYDDDDYDYDYDDDYYGDEYGVTPDAKYYEGLVDSIDYSVGYDISFEDFSSMTETGYSDNLEFNIYYVVLEGDQIPHLNEINRQLQEYSIWSVDLLEEEAENYPDEDFYMSSYAYVTYNDEQQISIVLSETIMLDGDYYVDLYSINVDLVNGTILNNTDMLRVDDDFVIEFREKSIEQNGDDFPNLTNEDIFDYLTDEDTLIVFYTPVGLEVGINYMDNDGYGGWITVTYKEYQNLLKKSG